MRRHNNGFECAVCDKRYQNRVDQFAKLVICILQSAFCVLPFAASAQSASRSIRQGNTAYREADFAAAIKDYQNALSKDDKNAVARFNMANAFQHSSNGNKAMQAYDEAIKNTADIGLKSNAYYNKGLTQLQQKDLAGAMESFKQSLRLSPGDNEARENLEKVRQELKRQQPQPNKQEDKKPPQSPPEQQKKQKQQQKMNQQMMEQKFKELQEQEKQLQKELQKQKTNQPDQEKDW